MNGIVYVDLKPDYAKLYNLPIKLPILITDFKDLNFDKPLPLEVILNGLKFEYEHTKNDYYKSYLVYFLYEQFKHYLNNSRLDKAEEVLDYADKFNDDYRSNFFRGLLYEALNDLKKAEVEFRKSISKNDSFVYSRFELAKLLYKNEEIEETIDELKKIILIDKNFSLSYNLLADVYIYSKDYDNALKTIIQGFSIDDGFQPFYEKLTAIYNDAGYFQNTVKFYNSAKSKIKSHKALYNVAFAYMNMGDLSKSVDILENLRTENKDYVYDLLARCYKLLGQYDRALSVLDNGYGITLSPIVGVSYANTLRSVMKLDDAYEIYEDVSKRSNNLETLFFAYYMYENYFHPKAQSVLVKISQILENLGEKHNERYFNEFEYIISKKPITLDSYVKKLNTFLGYYFAYVPSKNFSLIYKENDLAYNLWMALFFKDDLLFERMVFENAITYSDKIILLLGGYILKYIIREGQVDDYILSYLDLKLSSYFVKTNEALYRIQKNLLQNKTDFKQAIELQDAISNIVYSFMLSDSPSDIRGEGYLKKYKPLLKVLIAFKTKENVLEDCLDSKEIFINSFTQMINSISRER